MRQETFAEFKKALQEVIDSFDETGNNSIAVMRIRQDGESLDENNSPTFDRRFQGVFVSRLHCQIILLDLLGLIHFQANRNGDLEFAGQIEGLKRAIGELFGIGESEAVDVGGGGNSLH